jgi:hypothetical protein
MGVLKIETRRVRPSFHGVSMCVVYFYNTRERFIKEVAPVQGAFYLASIRMPPAQLIHLTDANTYPYLPHATPDPVVVMIS